MKFVEAWLTLGLNQAAHQVEDYRQHHTSDDRNVQVKEEVERDQHEDEDDEMQKDAFVHGGSDG
jgi:hypothetical protein